MRAPAEVTGLPTLTILEATHLTSSEYVQYGIAGRSIDAARIVTSISHFDHGQWSAEVTYVTQDGPEPGWRDSAASVSIRYDRKYGAQECTFELSGSSWRAKSVEELETQLLLMELARGIARLHGASFKGGEV